MIKRKILSLLSVAVLSISFLSTNVSAAENVPSDTIDIESHDYDSVIESLGIDADSVVDIQIFDNIIVPQECIQPNIDNPGFRAWYDTGAYITKTGGPREAWSTSPVSTDYISPGGSISHTYSQTIASTASFTFGTTAVKQVSAGLGFSSTGSQTVTKTLSQSNSTKKGMYFDVYVIYSVYDYKLTGNLSNENLGSGTFKVATGLAGVTRQ